MTGSLEGVREYWDAYARALRVRGAEWGSREFFSAIKFQHDAAYANANGILDLDALAGRSLLELGCGMGFDTVEFARHGAAVTAVDIAPTCVALTKRFLAYHGLDAAVSVADAEHLPFPDGCFDIVVARGLLMFTPDESRVVREIRRVLRLGGEVNVLLHNRFSWYVLLAALSRTNRVTEWGDPPVNRLHTVRQARRLFADFSSMTIHGDRFPTTTDRDGLLSALHNALVVPVTRWMPRPLIRPFGYYIIVKAIK